ncbi:motility associated factor glycosyltransferase family protein [Helicobacter sp. MIT 21-1697]|uniref:motility associated factor glycosyltransferase family protein n=1 Tax=Helicobacter sp. MIT 21-1697 TaxID=2993733 RepID=UPI00224A8C5A|nr:motility associated factor glycosyltransferase family protein [Helicobacter sp. MIT 21-1697]MCX2716588.1 motility associated factor glycosyltransferase family protein [Helicobacter sp. MIT 21-1697]
MQDFFSLNLSALAIRSPALALRLNEFKPNQDFEVYQGSDPLNINIIDKRTNTALFQGNPLEETNAKIEAFAQYSHYPYLYFFGVGNGVFYKVLLQNDFLKRIIVLEPEIELLFIVLHFMDFSKEILEKHLIFIDAKNCDSTSIDILFASERDAKIYSKVYDLHLFNPYYELYSELYIKINQFFIRSIEHSVISVGNDSRDSIIGISHHIQNLPDVIKSPTLLNLLEQIKGRDTAIIVATGPSLSKQIPHLKQIQDYATIFCIDASFPILAKEGIKPDIVFSLERVELTAKFYEDTPKPAHKGVIFAITSIVHNRLKNALKGDLVQYSLRPFGYTNYFEIPEYGYLGIGMSAANMAYELIVHSRFKRCIIIGQDLAFGEDGTSHAKNAVYGANEINPEEMEQKGQKIMVEKYGGGGMIESTKVWKLFLTFYERDIANTPYPIEVINATEGGARIHGTKEIPFPEAIKLIDTSHKKSPITLSLPSSESYEANLAKIKQKTRDWIELGLKDKAFVEEVFLEVAALTERFELLNKEQRLEELKSEELQKCIDRIQEVKELFDNKRFRECFMDALQSYIFHQEMDIARILVMPANNEEAKLVKQAELIYAHKYWLFSLAGGMDSVIEVVKKAFATWEV